MKLFQEPLLDNLEKQICVYADFPLEQDGTLDFMAVRSKWALGNTTVRSIIFRGSYLKVFGQKRRLYESGSHPE